MAETDHIAAIDAYFKRSSEALSRAAADPSVRAAINRITAVIAQCFRAGGKLMLAGNGGSAADAQHIAAEFLSRFTMDRKPLPAIALTTDTSVLTAVGNDYGFERVFERQMRGLGMQRRRVRRHFNVGAVAEYFGCAQGCPRARDHDSRNHRSQDVADDCALRSILDSTIGGDRHRAANSYRCRAHDLWTG